jgi:hypothetical protein
MSVPAPAPARELELVGKVEMRIALVKDEKLESILKVYLPPLLLKLGSDSEAVRNKVCSREAGGKCITAHAPTGHIHMPTYQNQARRQSVRPSDSLPFRVV